MSRTNINSISDAYTMEPVTKFSKSRVTFAITTENTYRANPSNATFVFIALLKREILRNT